MMRASGAMKVLLPDVDEYLESHDREASFWRLLEALDADVHNGRIPTRAVGLAVLFQRVIEHRAGDERPEKLARAAEEIIDPVGTRARVARRILGRARYIVASQSRFTHVQPKSFQPVVFMRADGFEEALHLFRLRSAAWGQGWDVYEGWLERYHQALEVPEGELQKARRSTRPRRRRRRGRRR